MSRPRFMFALIAFLLLSATVERQSAEAGVIELCNLRSAARLKATRPCRAGFLHPGGCQGPSQCGHTNGCDWCPGCGECDCTCNCNPCCEMFSETCAEPLVDCCATTCDTVVSSGTPALGGGGGAVSGFFNPGILLAAIPPLFITDEGPPSFSPPGENPPQDPEDPPQDPEDPPDTTGSPLVPEPGSVTLWLAGASALMLRRKRRLT